jgi:predicted DNA binding protein
VTVIAEFTMDPEAFPLGRVFAESPGVRLELDRVVPNDDTVMPYFWVHRTAKDRSLAAIERVFADLVELREVRLMDDLGHRGLFRAEWDPAYLGIMRAVSETGVTVLSASGSRERWTFEIRTDGADQLSAFDRFCRDNSVDVTLARLSQLSSALRTGGDDGDGDGDVTIGGLTAPQREALVLAYREGYYDDTRTTDLNALADQLGISRQALSARLRRGYRTLVRGTLLPGTE